MYLEFGQTYATQDYYSAVGSIYESILIYNNITYKKYNNIFLKLGIIIFIIVILVSNVSIILKIEKCKKIINNNLLYIQSTYKTIDRNAQMERKTIRDGNIEYYVKACGVKSTISFDEDGKEEKFHKNSAYYYADYYQDLKEPTIIYTDHGAKAEKISIEEIENNYRKIHSVRKKLQNFFENKDITDLEISFSDEMINKIFEENKKDDTWENKYVINTDNGTITVYEDVRFHGFNYEYMNERGWINISYRIYED